MILYHGRLVESFMKGAREKGYSVEVISLAKKR